MGVKWCIGYSWRILHIVLGLESLLIFNLWSPWTLIMGMGCMGKSIVARTHLNKVSKVKWFFSNTGAMLDKCISTTATSEGAVNMCIFAPKQHYLRLLMREVSQLHVLVWLCLQHETDTKFSKLLAVLVHSWKIFSSWVSLQPHTFASHTLISSHLTHLRFLLLL